jgi:hypothetical protein
MTMHGQDANINPKIAEALGLSSLAPEAVARELAEIAGLRPPTRRESVEFLVATLRRATNEIPTVPAAWSWGEFHHAGIGPADELIRSDDSVRLAICASDLGLADQPSPNSADTPRQALSQNLMEATDALLRSLRELLEAAEISTYGHPGPPSLGS